MKVEWSQPARDDLAQIRAHIAADSPRYARQFSERIIGAVRKVPEGDRERGQLKKKAS